MEVNGHKHYCVQQKKVWKIADDRIGFFGRTSALKQLYVVMFSIFKLNHSDKYLQSLSVHMHFYRISYPLTKLIIFPEQTFGVSEGKKHKPFIV